MKYENTSLLGGLLGQIKELNKGGSKGDVAALLELMSDQGEVPISYMSELRKSGDWSDGGAAQAAPVLSSVPGRESCANSQGFWRGMDERYHNHGGKNYEPNFNNRG